MALERRRSNGRQYSDREWESQRDNFHFYYIQQGLTLKEAAQCMKDNHGFDATLRQWERRIGPEKWAFQKYENRERRLEAIAQSGKSLLEVGSRGRRRSTGSTSSQADLTENRNMRRFARREASRESRQRAKSVSEYSSQAGDTSDGASNPTSPVRIPTTSGRGRIALETSQSNPEFFGRNINAWQLGVPESSRLVNQDPIVPGIMVSPPNEAAIQANPLDFDDTIVSSGNDFGMMGPAAADTSFIPFDIGSLESSRLESFLQGEDHVGMADNPYNNFMEETLSPTDESMQGAQWNSQSNWQDEIVNRSMDNTSAVSANLSGGFGVVGSPQHSSIPPGLAGMDLDQPSEDPGGSLATFDADFGYKVYADVVNQLDELNQSILHVVSNFIQSAKSPQLRSIFTSHLELPIQNTGQQHGHKIKTLLENAVTTQQRSTKGIIESCKLLRRENTLLRQEIAQVREGNIGLQPMVNFDNSGMSSSFDRSDWHAP